MRIGCVDFVSNTFFPATAAEELGFFRAEGIDAHVELLRTLVAFPALRDGEVEFLAAPAHSVLRAFPEWNGAKLVVALAQGTPWLVVLRADVPGARGAVSALKGLRIAAAQGPNLVFRQFLVELGLEPGRDVEIISLPGGEDADVNFGVMAARALEDGLIDGFFANAMGAEVSIQRKIGRIHIDARRDGARYAAASRFTFAALITTDDVIARRGNDVAAVVRGIVKAQKALRAEPARATEVGQRRFPSEEATLIASLVARDLPFYDSRITEEAAAGVNALAQGLGLIKAPIPYERMVAGMFRDLWAL
ncbi:MAG: ABC transporter substrate-binding protein [Xanthobacteraceae bacterium]|nr:ABC transporter substrate-binding protein [Xanthobacteraceae bacterium]